MFSGLENRPKPPGGSGSSFVLPGYVGGLALSNDGGSPNTVLDIATGACASDDFAALLKYASAFTKNCNAAFGAGSGNGALDSGSTLAASTWYHLWAIGKSDGSAADFLLSTSATAPAMPAGYSRKRRLGSIKTDASAHILAFTQYGAGNRRQYIWTGGGFTDQNASSVSGTRTLYTLASVPSGIAVEAMINGEFSGTLGVGSFEFGSTTGDPTQGNTSVVTAGRQWNGGPLLIRTNTSQQIYVQGSNSGGTFSIGTTGWWDDI